MQMRALLIMGLIVASAIAVGCERWDPFDSETPATTDAVQPTDRPEAAAVTDPRDVELAQREADLRALQDAYAGLEEQHRQLTEEAQEMEWINDQLLATIRDLNSTIEQRDQLVIEVEQLRVENLRLRKRIQVLNADLKVHQDQLETMRQMRLSPADAPTESQDDADVVPEAATDVPAESPGDSE